MSAYLNVQPVGNTFRRPDMPTVNLKPVPMPQLEKKTDLTPTQLEALDLVRQDIRVTSSVQPIHRILGRTYGLPAAKNPATEIVEQLAPLSSSNIHLAVKAFVVGAGFAAASLFATSNIFQSPDNKFGGILIGLIALLSLPVIGAEFTNRDLRREFELIPLEPDHLPGLDKILTEGCTPEQFGAFIENDLLPRIPIGHFRSMANESGTCLHDIMYWRRDDLHFSGTNWEMIHRVIKNLGVGNDISLRVKAALIVIERDTTLNEAYLPELDAELAELAAVIEP
jgi:hypothetical protein